MSASFTKQMAAEFVPPWRKTWNFTDRFFKFFQWLAFTVAIAIAADKTGSAPLKLLTVLLCLPVLVIIFMPLFIIIGKKGWAAPNAGLLKLIAALGWLIVGIGGMVVTGFVWHEISLVTNDLITAAHQPTACK